MPRQPPSWIGCFNYIKYNAIHFLYSKQHHKGHVMYITFGSFLKPGTWDFIIKMRKHCLMDPRRPADDDPRLSGMLSREWH